MTKKVSLIISSLLTLASTAGAYWDSSQCGAYTLVINRQQREVDQFDYLVVKPLQNQLADLNSQLQVEINRPLEIEKNNRIRADKIILLSAENERRARMIANEEQEIIQKEGELEAATAAGDKVKMRNLSAAIKKLRATINTREKNTAIAEAEISRLTQINADRELERQTILNTPPSAAELSLSIQGIQLKLADTKNLQNEKIQDLSLSRMAYDTCLNYSDLQRRYDDLSIRCNGR